jgi:hypothetical protein
MTRTMLAASIASGPFLKVSGWDAADWQFAIEERAAILEYDEGLLRADAETLAAAQIAAQRRKQLQTSRAKHQTNVEENRCA